jgi:hypothetical protein
VFTTLNGQSGTEVMLNDERNVEKERKIKKEERGGTDMRRTPQAVALQRRPNEVDRMRET